ncbi:hypothetical protein G9A89_000929 [Geosiphon pyriformis]|nr:hypothetical protein G9A89_000929 [Geosiphon pyriformis]
MNQEIHPQSTSLFTQAVLSNGTVIQIPVPTLSELQKILEESQKDCISLPSTNFETNSFNLFRLTLKKIVDEANVPCRTKMNHEISMVASKSWSEAVEEYRFQFYILARDI